MKERFIEAGEIVGTHGVNGEVKLQPWTDSAAFLLRFRTLYIDGLPREVESSRIHKDMLLLKLRDVPDVNAAMRLKGRVVRFDRADAGLPEGTFFLRDLLGARVVTEGNEPVGVLEDVLEYPASRVYVVRGETEHLIPERPEFIVSADPDAGVLVVRLIEGM